MRRRCSAEVGSGCRQTELVCALAAMVRLKPDTDCEVVLALTGRRSR